MTEPRQSGEFHQADPAYRRQMTIWLAVCVVGGAIFLFALQRWLGHLSATIGGSDQSQMLIWLQRVEAGTCLLLAAAAVGLALWIRQAAKQARSERRWPPSGMRTTRDVRIRYLTSADALVSQLSAAAIGLIVFALILSAFAIWLLRPA